MNQRLLRIMSLTLASGLLTLVTAPFAQAVDVPDSVFNPVFPRGPRLEFICRMQRYFAIERVDDRQKGFCVGWKFARTIAQQAVTRRINVNLVVRK